MHTSYHISALIGFKSPLDVSLDHMVSVAPRKIPAKPFLILRRFSFLQFIDHCKNKKK